MKNIWKYILIGIPVLLLIASAVFFLIKLPTSEKQSKYSELITLGNSQFDQNEFAKALTSYNDAVELIDTKVEAYEGIAKVLVVKNQLGQLGQVLDSSALKLSGDDQSKLYSILGEGYFVVGNSDLAQTNYEKAVNLSYSNELAKIGLAKAYFAQGNYEKARNYLDIPSNSSNYEKAYFLKLVGKYNDLAAIQEVLKETVTITDETIKKSVEDFKTVAKRTAEEDLYISALLGKIYVNNGFPKLAISLLEPKREAILEYGDGVYILASAYFNTADYTKTITLLKDYSNPNADPDLHLLMARSNVEINEITDAIKNYDLAVLSSGDKNESVYIEYSDFLLDQAQYTKAKEVLDKADKKLDENWIDIAYLRMYFEQKNNAKAKFYMDKLAKATTLTDPEKKEYMFFAISQYIEEQKTNDAIILLAKLKELDKINPRYYFLAGKLHLQTANVNEAKKELEQAIDYDLTGEVTESAKNLLSRVN